MKVYAAINAVSADLAKSGIAKDSKNQQQGYAFRGIDAVLNALAPLLAKHGLCLLPRVMARQTTERLTKSGGSLFSTVLDVEFDFVHAEDGSKHTVKVVGEAMDSADKSCNKCLSAAYKYAAFLTFCIPTEATDANDADASSPDASVPKPPKGFEEWFADMVACAEEGVVALKKAWSESPEPLREYAQHFHNDEWVAAKKRSAAADKKRKVEA